MAREIAQGSPNTGVASSTIIVEWVDRRRIGKVDEAADEDSVASEVGIQFVSGVVPIEQALTLTRE